MALCCKYFSIICTSSRELCHERVSHILTCHQCWLQASTPPSSWYTAPEVLEREVTQVFTQHWVCVGHLGGLQSPESYQSGTYLDMPWVVTRADDGQLRAFHNVSRHADC